MSELVVYFESNQFSDKPIEHLKIFATMLSEQFIQDIKTFEEQTSNYENYHKIVNLSLYLLIIIYNLRKLKLFLEFLFDKDSIIMIVIKKLLTICKNLKNQDEISIIYSTLFYDDEFLQCTKNVEQLVNHHRDSLYNFNLRKIQLYSVPVYICILEYLVNLDYTFENLFEKKICEENDKPTGKNFQVN